LAGRSLSRCCRFCVRVVFFFQAEDGIRDFHVTGVQTCALPILARALGVQLVYTTGLFDAGALSAFPLIIRLRNDADLRAGRKYLSVDERIARGLAELDPPDGSGRIAAVRVFRRPAPAEVTA